MTLPRRILNMLVALDCFLFAVLCLGNVQRGETASEAAWKLERDGKFFGFTRPLIDTLFFFDPNHCRTSYEHAVEFAKLKGSKP